MRLQQGRGGTAVSSWQEHEAQLIAAKCYYMYTLRDASSLGILRSADLHTLYSPVW